MSGGLDIRGLEKALAGQPVLRGVDLAVRPGELVALLGPSGAGKTTLFRCVARLVRPDAGRIRLGGAESAPDLARLEGAALVAARRRVGLVFQQFNLMRRLSALDNVLTGRLHGLPLWRAALRRFPEAERQAALAALDRVGLLSQALVRADRLSGGQQQRVALARVLVQNVSLLLADEPVASLDPETAAGVLGLLREIARERRIAVLVSLHQLDYARGFADRVVGLGRGRVLFDLPPAGLEEGHLRTLFAPPAG
ncbi:phosphonate ABC transporter ATP-binding protein [Oleisolibacter albus]|uniref:phosphonate ABC transporter ATP-binding protein n=1 Tax=Oleisolibacter albus TaxID=2171757 RepID=UPI000DF27EE6|nr:phosphonate ABC transporter ATP-binding protein [Oleisolibacter albus]